MVFTAFVAAATMVFSVYVPATRGYFNIGEVMVYTCAILLGPFVGAFAGGVGSMISDIALGYTVFAPATLVIKAAEGFIVGYLSRKAVVRSKWQWRIFTCAVGVGVGLLVGFIGMTYYVGDVEANLGLPFLGSQVVTFHIPVVFWIVVGTLALVLIIIGGLLTDPIVGWPVISVLFGGVEMVLGYFLYETYLLGVGAALLEVPVNLGQVVVGLIVSIPIARSVSRLIPSLSYHPETSVNYVEGLFDIDDSPPHRQ